MEDYEIVGRENEIKTIEEEVISKLRNNKTGIIHLTGAPGTGKTLSVDYVLSRLKFNKLYENVKQIYVNCLKISSCKLILLRICSEHGLKVPRTLSLNQLASKLSQAFQETQTILVLDELDSLPKNQSTEFTTLCMSWPIILIGISNIADLSSRYDTLLKVAGRQNVTRLVYKPYDAKTIKKIFEWYAKNDENYIVTNEVISTKGIDFIAKKAAKEKGDLRQALDSFKALLDDSMRLEVSNMSCVMNSIKKRQKKRERDLPIQTQLLLLICASSKSSSILLKDCHEKFCQVNEKLGEQYFSQYDMRPLITNLQTLGLIGLKKASRNNSSNEVIYLKSDPTEIDMFLTEKDRIMQYL